MYVRARRIASCVVVLAFASSDFFSARAEDERRVAKPPRERQEDALTGTLFLQSMPIELVKDVAGRTERVNDTAGASLGGEIGYRLYSGSTGADGLFAGGSFVTMPLAYPRVAADLASADLQTFTASGAALDIGAQKVTSLGFTIGGGIGVMYLAYRLPNDIRRIPLAFEPHVFPRLLLTAGWSF